MEFAENLARAVKESGVAPVGPPNPETAGGERDAIDRSRPPDGSADRESPQSTASLDTPSGEQERLEPAPRSPRTGVWAAVGILLLTGLFGAWLITRRSTDPVPVESPPAPGISEKPATEPPRPEPASPAVTGPQPPKKAELPRRKPKPAPVAPSVPERVPSTTSTTASPAKPIQIAPSETVQTGTITWEGRLRKNSLLVIADGKPNVGTLAGSLPGVPVTVDVEPASVQIRVMPAAENAWKNLILYCTQDRVSSITIRWTEQPNHRQE
jgi:hypothetical protein